MTLEKDRPKYPDFISWYRTTIPKGWMIPRHIQRIGEKLDAVLEGSLDRLAIHMPPRHGKSETVTIRFALRWLECNPGKNLLVTGYNERFARKFSRRIRNMAAERGLVASDKSASDEWETTGGSLVMARGVGSPPTGTGFGLIIIDDPVRKREDAESEVYREKVWDWYTDDLYSRLEPGGALVIVMTLWHEDDLGARAVASEPFDILKLPAISEEGEALWPERYNVESLSRIRDVMAQNEGLRGWEALYQQNPTPREGAFFKVSQFEVVDRVPVGLPTVRAWDKAASLDGDYTVGVKMCGPDGAGYYYVVDVVRGQWDVGTRDQKIIETAQLDGKHVLQRGPQDPGQAGVVDAKAFVRMLAGFKVKTEPISGNKETRAAPVASQANVGNIRLFRGDWNRAFIEECRSFPGGKHDDQIDAFADSFSELARPRLADSLDRFL